MPLSDYTSSVGGGLKLKGVKDGRVKKSKKKSSKAAIDKDDTKAEEQDQPVSQEVAEVHRTETQPTRYAKTEAQLQFEERRRKKLDEQAEREGVKSHKEKVEELNKYLSKLSEHHDMPRIGPG